MIHRVISAVMEGMTSSDPLHSAQYPFPNAELFHAFAHILGTRRIKSALHPDHLPYRLRRPMIGGDGLLIQKNEEEDGFFHVREENWDIFCMDASIISLIS